MEDRDAGCYSDILIVVAVLCFSEIEMRIFDYFSYDSE